MKLYAHRNSGAARVMIFGVMGALLALATLAPILAAQGSAELYALFRGACHQASERCFCIAERPMALCARCVGIYGGAMLAALLLPERWLSRKTLLVLLSVGASSVALDVALEAAGLYHNVKWLRLITGAALGFALAPFVIVALAELRSLKRGTEKSAKNLS